MILKKAAKPMALILLVLLFLASILLFRLPEKSFGKPIQISFPDTELMPEGSSDPNYNFWAALPMLSQGSVRIREEIPMQTEIYDALCEQIDILTANEVLPPISIRNPDFSKLHLLRYTHGENAREQHLDVWEIIARFPDKQCLIYMEANTHAILELHIFSIKPDPTFLTTLPFYFKLYLHDICTFRVDSTLNFDVSSYQNEYEISLVLESIDRQTGEQRIYLFWQNEEDLIDFFEEESVLITE